MVKHCLALILLSTILIKANAQAAIKVAYKEGNQIKLSIDSILLAKAFKQTLSDGSNITEVHIESVNQWHYLVGKAQHGTYPKLIAVSVSYNLNNRIFEVMPQAMHKICAAAACVDCSFFKENGNITGCKCADKKTVSNECTYKHTKEASFYYHLARVIKLNNMSR
jgi:hypothetical protein